MSTSMSMSILQWLKSQYIVVPMDWLDACVQWITEENEGRRLDKSFLQKQVYEQWLTADLSELNTPVLPQQIMETKFTLKGTFCLQINSILDISQPCYAQLNKIQNVNDTNTMVSAETQATQHLPAWKESANRMLMMKLTDGVNEINGMEYQKIPCFSDTITPGTKVRIKGPIMCRRGTLMLLPCNIQMLGGEVEDLVEVNRKEAVLCRALNRPVPAPNSNFSLNIHQHPTTNNQNDFELPDDLISQLTEDDFNITDSGYQTMSHNPSTTSNNISSNSYNSHISSSNLAVSNNSNNPYQNTNISRNTPSSNIPSSGKNNDVVVIKDSNEMEELVDLDDFEMMLEIEKLEQTKTGQRCHSPVIPGSKVPPKSNNQVSTSCSTSAQVLSVSRQSSNPKNNLHTKQISIKDAFEQKFKTAPTVTHPIKSTTKTATVRPISAVLSKQMLNSSSKDDYDSDNECPSIFSRLKRGEKSSLTNPSPMTSCDDPDNINTIPTSVDISPTCNLSQESFKYLCQAKKKLQNGETSFIITVEAFILTLLSKLQIEESILKGWLLKARICDGTDNLDVQFNDQVLTQLIGFTALKANKIRKERNPSELLQLKLGMENCRNKIIEMCKLMNIRFSVTSIPVITKILDGET